MKKEFTLLALLFTALLLALYPAPVKSDFTVIRVPADYPSIQSAINAAAPESIILVSDGIYHEHLVVNKTLTLIGEGKATTIIDGNGTGRVITITADNIVIDGFTIRDGVYGVYLDQSQNSTISSNNLISNELGIYLRRSNDSVITGNTITSSKYDGVYLYKSGNNTITGNMILNNGHGDYIFKVGGVALIDSNNNTITSNMVISNFLGIDLSQNSSGNTIYHNNFIENSGQVLHFEAPLSSNTWDNSTEGNYWDDYAGLDDGSDGRVIGDGVGDTELPHLEVDYYPLITPLRFIPIIWDDVTHPVTLLSNSTVSAFRFIQAEKKIEFNVRGPSETFGYCNLTIPKNLLRDHPWKILLNDTDITSQAIINENQTYTSIYFTYTHSTYNIQIIGTWVIPEFPSTIVLLLFMILTMLILVFIKKSSNRQTFCTRKSKPKPNAHTHLRIVEKKGFCEGHLHRF